MRTYVRTRVAGGSYFFTVNLAERHGNRLLVDHVHLLRNAFRSVRAAHPFVTEAMVVLPEHLHCIWRLPEGDDRFDMRWRLIKTAFSRSLKRHEPVSASRARKGERGIWQRRYWEHLIRDEHDFATHMNYVHYNPVKHGLVTRVADWPYSTFHQRVAQGVYRLDWGLSRDELPYTQ